MRTLSTLATSISLLVLGGFAHADATLRFAVTTSEQPKPAVQTVYVAGGKFLVKAAGGDPRIDLLYERGKDTMFVIDHQSKSYIAFDENAIAKLGQAAAMMAAVQRQLAEQMKDMPPEQKAKLRELLGGMADPETTDDAAANAPRTIKKLGNKSVSGIKCQQMEVYRGAKKQSEMCVADPGTIGLSGEDMKTIHALQAFQERMWAQASKISNKMGGHMPEFGGKNIPGVPVKMKDFAGPAPTTMTVTKVDPGVGGKVLSLPKGYSATSLPNLGGVKLKTVPKIKITPKQTPAPAKP